MSYNPSKPHGVSRPGTSTTAPVSAKPKNEWTCGDFKREIEKIIRPHNLFLRSERSEVATPVSDGKLWRWVIPWEVETQRPGYAYRAYDKEKSDPYVKFMTEVDEETALWLLFEWLDAVDREQKTRNQS
ncbi:hypothetical protein DFH11DRAFT_1544084 [Phellopilus nigrolimitatus]|nr:hypothetical protein DFH11DRAFT_1544084 [Phellopilus nigrolimitatus]